MYEGAVERGGTVRWGWPLVVVALVGSGALWFEHLRASAPVAGLFRDEAVYISVASSLAQGTGYRQPSLPGTPPELRYPPLVPATLAIVWRMVPRFPDNLPLLKGVCALTGLLLVLLLPGYLQRVGFSSGVAFMTAALTAVSPMVLRYATSVTSELPFALVTVLALWAIEMAAVPAAARGWIACAGMLAGLTMLTRVVGFTVIGAGALMLWRRAGWRRGVGFGLAAALCVLPWLGWTMVQRGAVAADHTYATILSEDGGLPGMAAILRNLAEIPFVVLGTAVPGMGQLLPGRQVPGFFISVYWIVGLVTALVAFRQRFGLYLLLSLVVFVLVPWGVQPRFMVPLIPFFLASLLGSVAGDGSARWRRLTYAVVAIALFASAAVGQQWQLARVRATGLPALHELSQATNWQAFVPALTWVREHTPPDEVLGTLYDPMLYLYTGRRAVRAYPSLWQPEPGQVDAWIERFNLRHLVELPAPPGAAPTAWKGWLAAHRSRLTPVYRGSTEDVTVWEILPEGAAR